MQSTVVDSGRRRGVWRVVEAGVLAWLVCWTGACQGPGANKATLGLYERVSTYAVEVLVQGHLAGSGAFIGNGSTVVTAGHVVCDPTGTVEIVTAQGQRLAAKGLALDAAHDLALLQVDGRPPGAGWLPLASEMPAVGADIHLMGTPLYRHSLLMGGSLAWARPGYEFPDKFEGYVQVHYISAMAPRGASGGVWVNERGEVVAVQSGWINESVGGEAVGTTNAGVAFGAGCEAIGTLLERAADIESTTLGGVLAELWMQPVGFIKRFESPAAGVVVHRLIPGGPLEQAGFVREDLITRVDGEPVDYRDRLLDIVRSKQVGDTVVLTVVKPDGKEGGQRTVTLGRFGSTPEAETEETVDDAANEGAAER